MVNETKNTKEAVLSLLYRSPDDVLSGVAISRKLDITRVAVWKHISALKNEGFDIESMPKGYRLNNKDDLLMPFCFPKDMRNRIYRFNSVESTMDTARSLAKEGACHLSAVVAENQTLGRGRLNRTWHSSQGGLWLTLILKPDIPPIYSYIYNFAASLTMASVLKKQFDVPVSVKWPNDLLIGSRKLAGLLSEMETRGDMVEFINIGIGLNVNNSPQKDEPRAISLKEYLGRPVCRKEILESFLHDFEQLTQTIDCEKIISRWKTMTSTIGSDVKIETLGDVFEGRAVDVDISGALILQTRDQSIQKIIYGDCFHT